MGGDQARFAELRASDDRVRRLLGYAGYIAVRLIELSLVALGLVFAFGSDEPRDAVEHLINWDLLASLYLVVGGILVRRARRRPVRARDPRLPRPLRFLSNPRSQFLLTMSASLTGVGAAATVVVDGTEDDLGLLLQLFGVTAMVLAWLLLHTGYAHFYAAVYQHDGSRGLQFPSTPNPGIIDMLYFSFTIGTSFAASDVNVTTRQMRWHVTVHSVISFFYNAAVLALAIGFITGK